MAINGVRPLFDGRFVNTVAESHGEMGSLKLTQFELDSASYNFPAQV
jgi:hypothetical protein